MVVNNLFALNANRKCLAIILWYMKLDVEGNNKVTLWYFLFLILKLVNEKLKCHHCKEMVVT